VSRLNDLITDSYFSLNHILPKISAYFKQLRQSITEQLQKDEDVLVYLIKRMEYCDSESVWDTLSQFLKGAYYKMTPNKVKELMDDLLA
jgi:hypothetical protein